ncbi:MAG: DNA repair protein RecO [Gammaproteobacteria bacterium]
MSETAVYLQPAFILRQRNYRETSLIIDTLTRDFGRMSLLAKGVRKAKSRTLGLLQPFMPLAVSFAGKAEMKYLTDVEWVQPGLGLNGLALYCGFYVNELVAHFLHRHDPHPEVFDHYRQCLDRLATGDSMEAALRIFELHLIVHAGYGLQLDRDYQTDQPVESAKNYRFHIELGPTEAEDGRYSGKTLRAIKAGEFADPGVLSEAKILMRTVLDAHMHGKVLRSRAVINTLIKQTKNELI